MDGGTRRKRGRRVRTKIKEVNAHLVTSQESPCVGTRAPVNVSSTPADRVATRIDISLNGGQIVNVDREIETDRFAAELNFANCQG